MKTKPWPLIVLTLLHVLAPVGNLILNAFAWGRTIGEQWHYWVNVLPVYLLATYMALPVLAGFFIFLCRRWSYWAYLVCVGLILISNVYSYSTRMDLSTLLLLILVAAVDLLVVAYFIVPSVQRVYFDPRMRWWEAARRYHFDQVASVNDAPANIKSLSQGGLFLTSTSVLSENEVVKVTWEHQGQVFELEGVVAYAGSLSGVKGYGIRFNHTSQSEVLVKNLIQELEIYGQVIKERMPGPEDSFAAWLRKLISTGEGLFPRKRA